MRDSCSLDQGGSSDGAEIKLDSQYNLVIKSTVFAFRFDMGFREKESRFTTVFGLNNCKNGVTIY